MANRWQNQFKASPEKGVTLYDGYISLSAAGAVVASNFAIKGTTVAKTGTGLYTITLKDRYPSLLAVHVTGVSSVTNANGNWKVQSVLTPAGVAAPAIVGACGLGRVGSIVIASTTSAGVAADVAVVCGVFVSLVLKNTTVK